MCVCVCVCGVCVWGGGGDTSYTRVNICEGIVYKVGSLEPIFCSSMEYAVSLL